MHNSAITACLVIFTLASACTVSKRSSDSEQQFDNATKSSDTEKIAAAVLSGDGYYAKCNGKKVNLESIVAPAIENMMQQGELPNRPLEFPWDKPTHEPGIRYTQNPGRALQDCSGNFLRLVSQVAGKCPEHEAKLPIDKGVLPYSKETDGKTINENIKIRARTTNQTAKWFNDQKLFTPVYCDGRYESFSADLEAAEKMIYPGAVVWFGKEKSCSNKAAGLDALIDNIAHMGTVESVERNDAGEVITYKIYHGRNTGKGSGINRLFRKYPGNTTGVPPFGNWFEPVVGIAPILPVTNGPTGASSGAEK